MKTHGTSLATLEQLETLGARLLIALPRALELLACEHNVDIKRALNFTGNRERDARALMVGISALVDGHIDTIPEVLLEPIGVIALPGIFDARPASFLDRPDIEIMSNDGYGAEFCRLLENADGPLPSEMVAAKLTAGSNDAAIVDYLGDEAFVMWRVIPMLIDSGELSDDRYYVLYVRTRGKEFSVSIWRVKARSVWRISPFPCGKGFRQKKGVIVLK